MSIGIITSLYGNYDNLLPCEADCHAVCVTDNPDLKIEGWETIHFRPSVDSTRLASRFAKCNPSMFIDADYIIWQDSNIQIIAPPHLLINALGNNHIAAFSHRMHKKLYQEASAVIRHGQADKNIVDAQMKNYIKDGFSGQAEMFECGFMIRQNTHQSQIFGNRWWSELCRWCDRDQLSFNYVLWKMGMGCERLPGFIEPSYFLHLHPHRIPRNTQKNIL